MKNSKRLFALCYAAAFLGWLLFCAVGAGVMLYQRSAGKMPTGLLAPASLRMESFVAYADLEWNTPPDDDPTWYLSTDADPKIYWDGEGYIETVRLYARHWLPSGGVALYYLLPGQTDYRETQKVYASVTAKGEYTFDLGGKTVCGIRIDPDSVGGVPTRFAGVELNPVTPWYERLVPNGGQLILLLAAPAFAAALLRLAAGLLPAAKPRA